MNISKIFLPIACFFAFVLLNCQNLYAQTDYVIMNDGTKVMGEVQSQTTSKVKFKAVGEKKSKKFKSADIKEGYKAGYGVFRSIVYAAGKKPAFLLVLEDGKIKLYEYYESSTSYYASGPYGAGNGTFGRTYNNVNKTWYAQKDGNEIAQVKTNQIWGSRKTRKDRFFNLIEDNAHVAERYQNEDKFSFDFIRSLVIEYNTLAK